MDFRLTLDGEKEIEIVDELERTVATFKIWEDEHGWLWSVSYADKRKATRVGRL